MTWLTHRDMENKMASFVPDAEFNYRQACQTRSDIHENLPVLRKYADKCEHVTEMGTRTGVSTWALVSSNANTIVLYDKDVRVGGWLEPHFLCAKELNKDITVIVVSHDISVILSYASKVAHINKKLVFHDISTKHQNFNKDEHFCEVEMLQLLGNLS